MENEDGITILLVEDDPLDVYAIRRTLKKLNIDTQLVVASDGIMALEILRGEHEQKITQPYLVLCDMHMPRMDGYTFVDELVRDPQLTSEHVWLMTFDGAPPPNFVQSPGTVAGILSKASINTELQQLLQSMQSK